LKPSLRKSATDFTLFLPFRYGMGTKKAGELRTYELDWGIR
jgi:hypothetical protein